MDSLSRRNFIRSSVAALLLTLAISAPGTVIASESDYSFLDGMSVSELEELRDEVSERLDNAISKKGESDSDDFGIWEVRHSKDEFGREDKDNAYIVCNTEGEFSNSATINSECIYAIFAFPLEDGGAMIGIRMGEYGSHIVQASFETVSYSISVLDKDEEVHKMDGLMLEDDSIVYIIEDRGGDTLYDMLLAGGPISFSIKETGDYATSSYRFTLEDTTGLSNAMASISSTQEATL